MNDLRGSGRRSVTPYVHKRMGVVLQCEVQALACHLVAWVQHEHSNVHRNLL
jgi:hypothetical protein